VVVVVVVVVVLVLGEKKDGCRREDSGMAVL
jgi:hypothetical protein